MDLAGLCEASILANMKDNSEGSGLNHPVPRLRARELAREPPVVYEHPCPDESPSGAEPPRARLSRRAKVDQEQPNSSRVSQTMSETEPALGPVPGNCHARATAVCHGDSQRQQPAAQEWAAHWEAGRTSVQAHRVKSSLVSSAPERPRPDPPEE
ncbi:hypothetical protein MHUMG1_00062 [Metarhizium humberi]|uniref:Uncharacterized protein n=1 Tax=Metarhizium humberi TaxID=2596975 RepID=A0A9P8MIY5_9HYPO|nr:hypothetical protein MHUMG1_00062 [Metarhizium humberi]